MPAREYSRSANRRAIRQLRELISQILPFFFFVLAVICIILFVRNESQLLAIGSLSAIFLGIGISYIFYHEKISARRYRAQSENLRNEMLSLKARLAELASIEDSIGSIRSFQKEIIDRQEEQNREILALISGVSHANAGKTEKSEIKPLSLTSERILSIYRQVSSGFRHSIRSPLTNAFTAIRNLSQRLQTIGRDAQNRKREYRDLVQQLERAIISLNLIEEILQHGAGFFPGELQTIDFEDLLWRAEGIARGATESKVKVHSSIKKPTFKYHSLNLLVALVEVLENAMEAAADNGEIRVICQEDKSSRMIRIDVSNTGRKITGRGRMKILKEKYSTKGGEHGIGLLLARDVLQAVDGTITLVDDRAHSKWTTFRIQFKPIQEKSLSRNSNA